MTAVHELNLANELGIPYAVICMVDNMANGLQEKELSYEQFREAVLKHEKTVEEVAGMILKHFVKKV